MSDISIAVAKANAECLCKVLDNSGDHIDPDAAALGPGRFARKVFDNLGAISAPNARRNLAQFGGRWRAVTKIAWQFSK